MGRGRALAEFVKTTLVGGLIIVLPVSLGILLLEQMIQSATTLALPFIQVMPFLHDSLAAHSRKAGVVALLVVSFLSGLLARTKWASRVGAAFERKVLNRIPLYPLLRRLAQRFTGENVRNELVPALLETVAGSHLLVFIIEWHDDGRATVLVPTAPSVVVGQIMIVDGGRLSILDATMPQILRSVSRWGTGLRDMTTHKR